MAVRSFAAVALEKWFVKKETLDIVRPHIQTLLQIYLKIIEECDHS